MTGIIAKNSEVKRIIKKLKAGDLTVNSVPEELSRNIDILRAERKLGLRKSGHRGFDVIRQEFFVEEEWFYLGDPDEPYSSKHKEIFPDFEEYYQFLDGDIYDDACYYQYDFPDEIIHKFHLDTNRLYARNSLISDTINGSLPGLSPEDRKVYQHIEKTVKKQYQNWLDKFNACSTYEELKKVCGKYERSAFFEKMPLRFFLFQYAYHDPSDKRRMDILMEYLSKDYCGGEAVQGLCLIYNPEEVVQKFNYNQQSKVTNSRRKKEVRDFANDWVNHNVVTETRGYFDSQTHLYCNETSVYQYTNCRGRKVLYRLESCCVKVCHVFTAFEDFASSRNRDLRNCDLSGAIDLEIDTSMYQTDSTTKLPVTADTDILYSISKSYWKDKFIVIQQWKNSKGQTIAKQLHKFEYFFDFVSFLKGDLSDSNLVLCEGLKYLNNTNELELKDARLTSSICEKFGIPYEKYTYNQKFIQEFPPTEKNEEETAVILQESRELASSDMSRSYNQISYITDLHLMHRIQNAGCRSREDVILTLQKIVDVIVQESHDITLIGGDVSSDFSIFELFVKLLDNSACGNQTFLFVLGNHEFWEFPDLSVEQITDKYRKLLEEYDMYLLQNDLFYENEVDNHGIIPYAELEQMTHTELTEKLRCSRLIVLGGTGFSGCNEEFNANDGIYRNTINREMEIQESQKFEKLYQKLLPVLGQKNTVIFTHSPQKDWNSNPNAHAKFVYVSGHTHRNVFYDDGEERIYADNQIGYRNNNPHLKDFLMDWEYDYFSDYEDGIYEITAQAYQDFMRGTNISMDFSRKIHILYMLKKNGYYCFIHKSKQGLLSILHGGILKRLEHKDIQYYYDHMDQMIATIKPPMDKYTAFQEKVAGTIQKIGGYGRIHGCIIDINFFNHVYVNPIDLTVTGYWASDVVQKVVYPNIPSLLKEQCPQLYTNYQKLIEGKRTDPLMAKQKETQLAMVPQLYLDTDIYKASREISKMQRLGCRILTIWNETALK
jgi:hypothetical protein